MKQHATGILTGVHTALLAVAMLGIALSSSAADWQPLWLVPALLVVAIASDAMAIHLRSMRVSASFSALVLAMVLLGPAPAAVISLTAITIDVVHRRPPLDKAMANLAAFAIFPLVGGLLFKAVHPTATEPILFVGAVLAVFVITISLNFALIFTGHAIATGARWWSGFRDYFMTMWPAECATAMFTAGLAYVGQRDGERALLVLAGFVLIFQYLLRYAKEAVDRSRELELRNRQLASLQVGLISTTLKTLALRDNMTARHSAAVARYSRAVADALGLSARDQDLIHTAALFHDVGKFIFPDHILLASRQLTDEDYEIVKRHPDVGAELIAEIDGYGPVAEIVRHHHERIDGLGYPAGLREDDIPLGSKIIAVADVYDAITARATYRKPVTVRAATAELRRCADSQLDQHIVEVFICLVETRGIRFQHADADDFEAELALDNRIRDYAAPLKEAALTSPVKVDAASVEDVAADRDDVALKV